MAPSEYPEPNVLTAHPTKGVRCRLLVVAAVWGGLHLLVAIPHFIVRIWRGSASQECIGIRNFVPVTNTIWRGAAPSSAGYAALAAAGVAAVIDLRAEADTSAVRQMVQAATIHVVHVPIRDGQTPTDAQLHLVAETIGTAGGPVFVHCQAGVGRTGSVVAALRIAAGQSPRDALEDALQVGPLSLEQQVFVLRSRRSRPQLLPVVVASRIIDSPRRLLSRLRG